MEPKPAYVIEWHTLLAYLLIGVAVVLGLSFVIDHVAGWLGVTELVESGRRRDLGLVIALAIGLPVTHMIARSLGLVPKRVRSP